MHPKTQLSSGLVSHTPQSSHVYNYRLADLLGIDRISQFLENFQFGKVTGIDLPNESAGILPSRKWKDENIGRKWTKGETIITGIGQGYMLVTPLQLAVATSIIANKGKIILPKINSDFSHNISEKLLENCSLVINIAGTSAFESAFFEKPALVFIDRGYTILPSINTVSYTHLTLPTILLV